MRASRFISPPISQFRARIRRHFPACLLMHLKRSFASGNPPSGLACCDVCTNVSTTSPLFPQNAAALSYRSNFMVADDENPVFPGRHDAVSGDPVGLDSRTRHAASKNQLRHCAKKQLLHVPTLSVLRRRLPRARRHDSDIDRSQHAPYVRTRAAAPRPLASIIWCCLFSEPETGRQIKRTIPVLKSPPEWLPALAIIMAHGSLPRP